MVLIDPNNRQTKQINGYTMKANKIITQKTDKTEFYPTVDIYSENIDELLAE